MSVLVSHNVCRRCEYSTLEVVDDVYRISMRDVVEDAGASLVVVQVIVCFLILVRILRDELAIDPREGSAGILGGVLQLEVAGRRDRNNDVRRLPRDSGTIGRIDRAGRGQIRDVLERHDRRIGELVKIVLIYIEVYGITGLALRIEHGNIVGDAMPLLRREGDLDAVLLGLILQNDAAALEQRELLIEVEHLCGIDLRAADRTPSVTDRTAITVSVDLVKVFPGNVYIALVDDNDLVVVAGGVSVLLAVSVVVGILELTANELAAHDDMSKAVIVDQIAKVLFRDVVALTDGILGTAAVVRCCNVDITANCETPLCVRIGHFEIVIDEHAELRCDTERIGIRDVLQRGRRIVLDNELCAVRTENIVTSQQDRGIAAAVTVLRSVVDDIVRNVSAPGFHRLYEFICRVQRRRNG